jgi:hypothetical protein
VAEDIEVGFVSPQAASEFYDYAGS